MDLLQHRRVVFAALRVSRKKTRPQGAVLFGADGGTRTRDLFLTKELVEKWSRKNKMQYIGEMFAANHTI